MLATGARVLGADHCRVAEAQSLLGAAVAGQGRYDEAEPLLLAAFALLEESLPDERRAEKLSAAAQLLVTLSKRGVKRSRPTNGVGVRLTIRTEPRIKNSKKCGPAEAFLSHYTGTPE